MTDRDELMHKTRAAVCLVNATRSGSVQSQEQREMMAFLALFHPEMSEKERFDMARKMTDG